MNVETESTKLMTFVKSLELHREGHLRALIVNYADERVKQHNQDLVEKVSKIKKKHWHLRYEGVNDEKQKRIHKHFNKEVTIYINSVLQDVLRIIKEEK